MKRASTHPRREAPETRVVARTRAMTSVAAAVGAALGVGYIIVDVLLQAFVFPEGSLGMALVWRALGVGTLLALWRAAAVEGQTLRWHYQVTRVALVALAASIGLVGSEMGGFLGPVTVNGFVFLAAGLATMLPNDWRVLVRMLAPAFLSTFLCLGVGVALHPAHHVQLTSPAALTSVGVDLFTCLSLTAFLIFGSHRQWQATSALADVRRLGRYRLEARLGAGGMNEVWLARDAAVDRTVALKLLRATDSGDDRLARFEREAQLTARLASPHTVRLLDFGQNPVDGSAWLVMERLDGLDLAALLDRDGPLDVRRAVHLARHAALSLAEAHAAGLVHRDIKPANLFVCRNDPTQDWLKVIDFGIARDARAVDGSLTQAGFVIGTPTFMAPEQMMGQPATPQADVYAFGACLHAMLTGLGPWDLLAGGEVFSLAPRMRPPAVVSLPGRPIPPELARLVAACLAWEPAARPADGAALVAALEALKVPPWPAEEARRAWTDKTSAYLQRRWEADTELSAPPARTT